MNSDVYVRNYELVNRNKFNPSKIEKICINSERGEILIGTASGNDIEVEYYIKEYRHKFKYIFKAYEDRNKLYIDLKSKISILSFDFYTGIIIEVKIPAQYKSKIEIISYTATVKISDCSLEKLKILSATGRIVIDRVAASKLYIRSVSSSITIKNIDKYGLLPGNESHISSTTGRVRVFFNCLFKSNIISTTTGNIELSINKNLEGYNILQTSVTNPDFLINKLFRSDKSKNYDFEVKSTCGKVRIS